MLIYVYPKYIERGKTGRGRFMIRLVEAWENMGVDITGNEKADADIALHVSRVHAKSKAKKHVLRVGPACIDTNMNWRKINHEKAQAVKRADAVVYQSEYSRQIYHELVCKPNVPETVIFNGADPRDYDVNPYESNFRYNFMASTREWLKQKRLKELIKSFILADIDDSFLWVCGDSKGLMEKYIDSDNIMFVGPVNDMVLARMYKLVASTGAYLHGVWVDACPNSVVEAQVAGCPAICTDQGGSKELLRHGVLIKDKPFKYRPTNLNKPPAIDRNAMANAMRYFAMKQGELQNVHFMQTDDLHIQNVAKKYLEFFKEVL